ncbi:tectonic-1 [Strongylocentrotus purpuratus]|uniref:Tectonic domain-containing protein n=1 Tax=Strongylocentrotus purpuratus TaxID=7668 RepID=A0A7M7NJD2_STRPU|nr:tectonic-1 [Strongylocentrotus purpuratus]
MAGLSADAKIVFILLFAAVKILAIAAQTTASVETTPNQQGTSNPATTATTPVQPQTTQNAETTQPQQQTTNLPTASPSTEVPANTDIGTCICDLTGNRCDVNCCCDPDCSSADVATFSQCSENAYVVEDKVCLRSSVIFNNNAEPETVDVTDPSLFCITRDNYAERNFYTVPQTVETVERFYELSDQYGSTSYAKPSEDTNATYSDFYKSGDVVYTLYESLALGQLGLPRGLTSDVCEDSNPAAYLFNQEVTCTRALTSLQTDCEQQPFLSARTYYEGFKVIGTPQFLQDNPLPSPILVNLTTSMPEATTTTPMTTPTATTPTPDPGAATLDPNATVIDEFTTLVPVTELPGYSFYDEAGLVNISIRLPVLCRIVFGFVVDCNYTTEEVPFPVYNASSGTCQDVVLEVKYIITHNSTDGIEEVEVELLLGSLTSTDLYPSQTFSTEFIKRDEVDVYPRSGNPGYVIGQPLMAGNLVEETQPDESIKQAISVGADPDSWLTVVRSSGDGTCVNDSDSRLPITFGENLRSGCTIQVSYESVSDVCGLIQATALNALNGNHPSHVATFGSSLPEVVGDWVEIFEDPISSNPVSNEQGVCNNMYMALHVEVLYANVGALANPQAKIIGVRYNYPDASGQTLRYQCIGPYCQQGAESLVQNFEVSVSVEFIDASTNPTASWAEKPAVESKLPNDFFYPFSGTSKAGKQSFNIIVHVVVLLVSVLATL